MLRWASVLAAELLHAGLASAAPATVEIRFVEPARYTDASTRFGSGLGPEATLAEIRRLFVEATTRVLAPDESLVVEVLDVDLAGFPAPGAQIPYGLREVTDVAPPAFRLRYGLTRRGRPVATGEERVTDIV